MSLRALGALALALAVGGVGGCRCPRLTVGAGGATVAPAPVPSGPASAAEQAKLAARGAAPGGTEGPGGFVPRGSARNFYAGAGGRLWYYLNNYYWGPADLEAGTGAERVWIRAEVRADFQDLLRWPERRALQSPPTKRTVEYWAVGPGSRSVRLDNHKDYWLLDPKTCSGSARVEVTLTLGRLAVRDDQGAWSTPTESYVLESRNYRDDQPPGVGAERTRFTPLDDRPTTTWAYAIPWSTGTSPLTRSAWQDLEIPAWKLLAARLDVPPASGGDAPPLAPAPPVVTPSEPAAPDAP